MTGVRGYSRPGSLEEALEARRAAPAAAWLAGGTFLLAGDARPKPESVIDLAEVLPRGIEASGGELLIGSGTTFTELAESPLPPPCVAEAVLTMANRNTRNRATLGGNLGADKSCSSLVPILVALGAELEFASPWKAKASRWRRRGGAAQGRMELEAWLRSGAENRDPSREPERASDLVLRVAIPLAPGRLAAYRRWNRTACDLSVLGAACAYSLEEGRLSGLRIALGGLGPKARRSPELEALFEGRALPSREAIEEAVAPLLKPIDDLRASAAFKRMRGAQLVAQALLEASPVQIQAAAPFKIPGPSAGGAA